MTPAVMAREHLDYFFAPLRRGPGANVIVSCIVRVAVDINQVVIPTKATANVLRSVLYDCDFNILNVNVHAYRIAESGALVNGKFLFYHAKSFV